MASAARATRGGTPSTMRPRSCGWIAPITASLRRIFARRLSCTTPAARPLRVNTRAHVDVGEHFAAVISDAGDQRIRQAAAAADRHADAVRLQEADEHEDAETRRLLVGRNEVLAGDPREVHADLVVLEVFADDVVRAHLDDAPELATLAALVQQRERRAERRRARCTASPRSSAATSRPGPPAGDTTSASLLENFAISAQVRSRSRWTASVEPSSNTDIIGGSGNT